MRGQAGIIEPDETPADTLVREMWEETGLVVEPTRLRGVFGGPESRVNYKNGDRAAYVMAIFECRVVDGHLCTDDEEILELAYCAASELSELPLAPWARSVLPALMRRDADPGFAPARWRPPQLS